MRKINRQSLLALLGTSAVLAAMAPVSINLDSLLAAGTEGELIRLNSACAGDAYCEYAPFEYCSGDPENPPDHPIPDYRDTSL